mmetsp:Transcript_106175/g.298521  ORF Transcript_106175/g.298521 Transcript_106175/m.298521 type:complete len:206 (-) Transcript_106175:260-877(-)
MLLGRARSTACDADSAASPKKTRRRTGRSLAPCSRRACPEGIARERRVCSASERKVPRGVWASEALRPLRCSRRVGAVGVTPSPLMTGLRVRSCRAGVRHVGSQSCCFGSSRKSRRRDSTAAAGTVCPKRRCTRPSPRRSLVSSTPRATGMLGPPKALGTLRVAAESLSMGSPRRQPLNSLLARCTLGPALRSPRPPLPALALFE